MAQLHTKGLVIVLLLLVTSAASAQKPQTRKGFWIGFGLGWGSYACEDCWGPYECQDCGGREGSYTGHVKLGGALSSKLLLGGEVVGWSKSESGETITVGNVSLNAYFYPQSTGGVFLSGGAGLSVVRSHGGELVAGDMAWPGLSLGAGYDVRVGTNVSIVPSLQWVYGEPESWVRQNFFHFSLGVTFH